MITKKKYIFISILIVSFNSIISQKNDQNSISFGMANPISLLSNTDTNAAYFLDLISKIDSIKFLKVHIKSSLNYNSPILLMENFLISIGNGKILKSKDKTYNWGFGKDAYFKTNIRRFKIAKGSQAIWESELYGFGIQFYTFYDRFLKNNWWFNATLYLNFGLNQEFLNNSTSSNNAQEIWRLKLGAKQLLNLGLKKTF